jgi:uncharacterized protein
MADCGACSLCCTLLGVPDIGKAPRVMCWHTTFHGGCKVHHTKTTDPQMAACNSFECVWLHSQKFPKEEMPRFMRPDQCHVVLGPNNPEEPLTLPVHVDPRYPQAFTVEPVAGWLRQKQKLGAKFEIHLGENVFMLPDEF